MCHGSNLNPPNRFETTYSEPDLEHLEWDVEYREQPRRIEYIADSSKSIVTENNSPDLNFRYSVNPYRGCAHGCSYCYARPFHEYLEYNAGLDFETKIVVKHDAPKLFRDFLSRSEWQPELIAFSGITDCYQPVGIVTKNALVVRDLDLLKSMAQRSLVRVSISITTLDARLDRGADPGDARLLFDVLRSMQRQDDEFSQIGDLLLAHGVGVDDDYVEGLNLLQGQARHEDVQATAWLLSRGADVHARIVDGRSSLHLAADRNTGVKVMELLLKQGAELNARDELGLTPLFYACQNEKLRIVKYLEERGGCV